MQVLNAFTVDVEDYFQVSAFENHVHRDQWDQWESRVEANTQRILKLLDRHDVKGTFFVLGWVAQRYPQIGQGNSRLRARNRLTRLLAPPDLRAFAERIPRRPAAFPRRFGRCRRRAGRIAIGRPVSRSPRVPCGPLEILVEEGFPVDSSIFPIHHDRYGMPSARTATAPAGDARRRALGVSPRGGPHGAHEPARQRRRLFRLYPLFWTGYCLGRINRREGQPFVFYVHPLGDRPEQPRIPVPLEAFPLPAICRIWGRPRTSSTACSAPFASAESATSSRRVRRLKTTIAKLRLRST